MAPDAEARHREKGVSRAVAASGIGLAALCAVAGIGALAAGEIGPAGLVVALGLAALFVVYGVVVSVTRTVVTRTSVRWKNGLVSRDIPLSAIEETSLYSFRGGRPAAVVVRWSDDGKPRAFSIESRDPEGLRAVIDGARRASLPETRITVDAESDAVRAEEEREEDRVARRA